MTESAYYRDRWIDIDPGALEQYQRMFQWNSGSMVFYAPADIREGQIVGELGCGPGHTAVEIAKWVGDTGHVHAFDINADFVEQATHNARAAGFESRISVHQSNGSSLPVAASTFDRITARNTLIYVDDIARTLLEFKRVLKPGGLMHAIEGDWPMMIVEPIPQDRWAAFVGAASHACRTPNIGRKLYGHLVNAGFADVDVQLITRPDTEGRLLGMITNMAGYAKAGNTLDDATIDQVIASVEKAVEHGTYLAIAPQFVVTARA